MAIEKAEALVLKTYELRETSLIAVFFTRHFGKIKGIIKGIRTFPNRYTTTLEPFSHNQIVFYYNLKRELHTVAHCDLIDDFFALRKDLQKLAYASYFMELLDSVTMLHEKGVEVFNLALDSLKLLSTQPDLKKIARIFEIRLLGLSGFKPHLHSCLLCEKRIDSHAHFSSSLGGLICRDCSRHDKSSLSVMKGTISSLNHIENSSWQRALQLKPSRPILQELERILKSFLDFHIQRPMRSLEFLNKLNRPLRKKVRNTHLLEVS